MARRQLCLLESGGLDVKRIVFEVKDEGNEVVLSQMSSGQSTVGRMTAGVTGQNTPVIAVVGAGNIGSRHLQGLARARFPATIHVVDPTASSLALAQSRVEEISPQAALEFRYASDLSALPETIDLAILACGAAPRRTLIEQMLASRQVGAFILEKFLFQSLGDHVAIGALLEARCIPTWVNTPRRAWPDYRVLAEQLKDRGPLTMVVSQNSGHGLATNLIHLVDLLVFLIGRYHGFRLAGRELRVDASASRHVGAIEFSGNVYGYTPRGDVLVIRQPVDASIEGRIEIIGNGLYIAIDEKDSRITQSDLKGVVAVAPFQCLYQSELTGLIAQDILQTGSCNLPDYAQSASLHRECLKAFLEAMGRDRDDEQAICPIT